eukprot:6601315-Pyramimonas_sp.AAC.1
MSLLAHLCYNVFTIMTLIFHPSPMATCQRTTRSSIMRDRRAMAVDVRTPWAATRRMTAIWAWAVTVFRFRRKLTSS